jgi:hypothetical protein
MTPKARDRALRRLSAATGLVTVSSIAATGMAAAAAHETGAKEAAQQTAGPAGQPAGAATGGQSVQRGGSQATYVYGAAPGPASPASHTTRPTVQPTSASPPSPPPGGAPPSPPPVSSTGS